MTGGNHHPPGLTTLASRVVGKGLGALRNRVELASVEWQEERARMTELMGWTVGLLFLGMMGVLLLTFTIIFLVPESFRVYVTVGFAVLYLIGAVGAWFTLMKLLNQEPFEETLRQVNKDRACFESLK